jgi:hypothetical protein
MLCVFTAVQLNYLVINAKLVIDAKAQKRRRPMTNEGRFSFLLQSASRLCGQPGFPGAPMMVQSSVLYDFRVPEIYGAR